MYKLKDTAYRAGIYCSYAIQLFQWAGQPIVKYLSAVQMLPGDEEGVNDSKKCCD